MPSLQQVSLATARLKAIADVLAKSRDIAELFEKKDIVCQGKSKDFVEGYEAGINAGISAMQIDLAKIDVEAIVKAFDTELDGPSKLT